MNGWFFADDPFMGIEYEKPLAELKEGIENGYLEEVIQKYMLNNPHALLLDLQPKPGLEKEINAASEKECAEYKLTLSEQDINDLVKQTEELIAYQKKEDSPEAVATIPMLELSDVNPKAEWYGVEESELEGVKVLHHDKFTNNVVYTRMLYDVRVLPQELIPYAGLLTELLGSMNTKNYTYGDLDNELNMHTGGFNVFINTYTENRIDENLIPKLIIDSKAMNNKLDKLFELAAEVVNNSILDDKERLKDVLTRHQARLDSDVKNNGFSYATKRDHSYYDNEGLFIELTSGSEYYWFVTDLTNNFDAESETIINNLKKAAELLFKKNNLIAFVTGSNNDMPVYTKELTNFISKQADGDVKLNNWSFELKKKNEGLETASKVQYAIMGYDFKKLGYEFNGKMRVLNKILSREWFYNRIRVIGGAYGGFSSVSSLGRVFFGSYRDPNLKETIETYKSTPEFLANYNATEKDMTGFILGTIGDLDNPLTPSDQGNVALRDYFFKRTQADAQKERDEVLSTTLDDVKAYGKMITDIVEKNNYCVYGSEEKIEENKDLFDELVKLVRKQ